MQKKIGQILREFLGLIWGGGIAPKHGWAVAPLAQADYLPALTYLRASNTAKFRAFKKCASMHFPQNNHTHYPVISMKS